MKTKTFILVTLFLIGCVSQSEKVKYNNTQSSFFRMLNGYNYEYYKAGNKIVEEELRVLLDKDLCEFIDSTRYFINWSGKIHDISSETQIIDQKEYISLKFKIEMTPREHLEPIFCITHIIERDSVGSDLIYNSVKNISDWSTVYFDGIIRRENTTKIDYSPWSIEDLRHAYPQYNFKLFGISSFDHGDTLSSALTRVLDVDNEIIDAFNQYTEKKITKESWEMFVEGIKQESTQSRMLLSPEENSWEHLYLNYMIRLKH